MANKDLCQFPQKRLLKVSGDTASSLPGVLGARMMGGGFGGCSLNLVHTEALPEVREHLTSAYRQSFGLEAEPLEVRLGDGVRLRP